MLKSKLLEFNEYKIDRDWLYAPSTYLVDSFEPFVEEIYLPEVSTKSGRLKFYLKENSESLFLKKKAKSIKLKNIFKKKNVVSLSLKDIFIDLRQHYPSNFAHAITIHLPLALYAQQYIKPLKKRLLLIFPASLPGYIKSLFETLGFEIVCTDSVITGVQCSYDLDSLICIRGALPEIIKTTLFKTDFPNKLIQAHYGLPTNIFISRRDTRKINNEIEVEKYLVKNGYEKIYMEDYSVLQQLAIVSLADKIVAIHGAALGPLIFRGLFDRKPLKLIEIFSPAHMSNIYRIVMHQVQGRWIGVRGKVWPKLIKQAYECEESKVRQYSLENFEVCLQSLEKAIDANAQ